MWNLRGLAGSRQFLFSRRRPGGFRTLGVARTLGECRCSSRHAGDRYEHAMIVVHSQWVYQYEIELPSKAIETPPGARSTGRRTNLALLLLLPLAVLTGLFSNTIGLDWAIDPAILHGTTALAILLLAPWKSVVVRKGLSHRRKGRVSSLTLLALVLIALTSGLVHSSGATDRVGPLTLMQVHVGAALLALPLALRHYQRHPVRPRITDASRRTFLRLSGVAAGTAIMWRGWEGLAEAAGWRGAARRFTGSHERGSHRPEALPVTSWLDDQTPQIDVAAWRVTIGGNPYSLDDLATSPRDSFGATLDCTGGWYSEQVWDGTRLDRLVDPAGWRSIEVRSATGYARRFPVRDLDRLWLVSSVGGEPLHPNNGFPVRIVAPDRRGFWWVKWVVSIQPSMVPWWIQSPFPVT